MTLLQQKKSTIALDLSTNTYFTGDIESIYILLLSTSGHFPENSQCFGTSLPRQIGEPKWKEEGTKGHKHVILMKKPMRCSHEQVVARRGKGRHVWLEEAEAGVEYTVINGSLWPQQIGRDCLNLLQRWFMSDLRNSFLTLRTENIPASVTYGCTWSCFQYMGWIRWSLQVILNFTFPWFKDLSCLRKLGVTNICL